MEGGAPAASPTSGGEATGDSGNAEAPTEGDLTTTDNIPLPVQPFAVAGYPRRRLRRVDCFIDGINYCRR